MRSLKNLYQDIKSTNNQREVAHTYDPKAVSTRKVKNSSPGVKPKSIRRSKQA